MEKNVLKLSPSPWHLGLRYYCLASICTYVWFHDELSRGFCVEQKYVIQNGSVQTTILNLNHSHFQLGLKRI